MHVTQVQKKHSFQICSFLTHSAISERNNDAMSRQEELNTPGKQTCFKTYHFECANPAYNENNNDNDHHGYLVISRVN